MCQRSSLLARILCLIVLLGGGSSCTSSARPTPTDGEPAREVWDESAGEPVLAEEGP